MDLGRTSPPAVARAARRLRDRLGRGLVLVGIVPEEPYAALLRALRAAGFGDVELGRVQGSPAPLPRLHELNRGRDLFLRRGALVLLSAPDEAGLRALLAATPDLSSTPDVGFEIAAALPVAEAERLLEQLRQHALEHTAKIDLSGLLPGDVAAARLRVEKLYMELAPAEESTEAAAVRAAVVPRKGGVSRGEVEDFLAALRGLRPEGWQHPLREELFTVAGTPASPAAPAVPRAVPLSLMFGQPGAGKTTFLRMLAHEYASGARDRLAVGPRVPVFVPLPAFSRALQERRAELRLVEFVDQWLAEQDVTDGVGLAGLGAKVVLLLDGLDEVQGSATRRAVLEAARRAHTDSGFAVVVTSRSFVVDDLTQEQLRAFTVRHLTAPSDSDLHGFLLSFYRERRVDRPRTEADAAWTRITSDGELRELARTPLLLVFLALLHELEGRIPERRFLLYKKVSEILLDRWERARARARGAGVPGRALALGDTQRVIGTLAWWMLEAGRVEIPTEALQPELERIERERGASAVEASARAHGLAEVLQTGMAVFSTGADGGWRFVHTTLAEFFAGVEAARGGLRFQQVVGEPCRPELQEVVTFMAGELGVRADDDRLELLGTALVRSHRRGGRYGAADVSTIGAVLREDPGFTHGTARRLVGRFVQLCFKPTYWPRSRWAVAEELRVTAEAAPQRTWGSAFREELLETLRGVQWREDHAEIAKGLHKILDGLGEPSDGVATRLCDSGVEALALEGWRWRYRAAPRDSREDVVSAALTALPGRNRFDVTHEINDLLALIQASSLGKLVRRRRRQVGESALGVGGEGK